MQFCQFFKSTFATSFDFYEHKSTNLPYHEQIDKLNLIKTTIYLSEVRLERNILFERFRLLGLNRILENDEVGWKS